MDGNWTHEIIGSGQRVFVAEGSQKGVFIDTKTLSPRRLLPEERALFTPFLETGNTG